MSFPCDENKPSFTPIQNKFNTCNGVYADLIKFSKSRPLTCQYHMPAFAVVYELLYRFIKHSNIHIPCVNLSFTSSCKYTTRNTVQIWRFQYLTLLCRLHNYPYCFRYVKCYAQQHRLWHFIIPVLLAVHMQQLYLLYILECDEIMTGRHSGDRGEKRIILKWISR